MKFSTRDRWCPRSTPWFTFSAVALLLPVVVHAQGLGVASLGATGGLTIPSAFVLEPGGMALSLGNYQDPSLGKYNRKQNYTMGIGLVPGVEVFGRFAEYTTSKNAPPGAPDAIGVRDISGNAKWQLPIEIEGLPKLAVGATDISGGAMYFGSQYMVASDEYGPLRWSLGYARGKPVGGPGTSIRGASPVLDGVFGGAEVKLGTTRATALVESDGTQRHAGLRYYSETLPWLGDAQLVGTVQRSFGARTRAGQGADATSVNVSLVLPLGQTEAGRKAQAGATGRPLPPLEPVADAPAMVATAQDRLDRLARALRAMGLDRVRVGMLGS